MTRCHLIKPVSTAAVGCDGKKKRRQRSGGYTTTYPVHRFRALNLRSVLEIFMHVGKILILYHSSPLISHVTHPCIVTNYGYRQ